MKKLWWMVVAVFFLTGCALLEKQEDESAKLIGKGIVQYCDNMPESERPEFKAKVEAECECVFDLTCPDELSEE